MTIKSILVPAELFAGINPSNTTVSLPFGHAVVEQITVVSSPKAFRTLGKGVYKSFCMETFSESVFMEFTTPSKQRKTVKIDNAVDYVKTSAGYVFYNASCEPVDLKGNVISGGDIAIPLMAVQHFDAWIGGNTLFVTEDAVNQMVDSCHVEVYAYYDAARSVKFTLSNKKQ